MSLANEPRHGTWHYRVRAGTPVASAWSEGRAVDVARGLTLDTIREAETFDTQAGASLRWCGQASCPIRMGLGQGASLGFPGAEVRVTEPDGALLGRCTVTPGATEVTVSLTRVPRDGLRVTVDAGWLEVDHLRPRRCHALLTRSPGDGRPARLPSPGG